MIEEIKEIPARFQPIDAGMLHLGGTRLPAGGRLPFGLTVTMDGRQGLHRWPTSPGKWNIEAWRTGS